MFGFHYKSCCWLISVLRTLYHIYSAVLFSPSACFCLCCSVFYLPGLLFSPLLYVFITRICIIFHLEVDSCISRILIPRTSCKPQFSVLGICSEMIFRRFIIYIRSFSCYFCHSLYLHSSTSLELISDYYL